MFTTTNTRSAGTVPSRFGSHAKRRLATFAATLATVAVAVSVIAPGASAHVSFSDKSSADTAFACFNGNYSGGILVGGMRSYSSTSWLWFSQHASTSGIWARSRALDRTTGRWTAWNNFEAMSPGYTSAGPLFLNYLQGGYTFQVQYAKQVYGRWEYKSHYAAALAVQSNNSTINPYYLVYDHSITSNVCYQ